MTQNRKKAMRGQRVGVRGHWTIPYSQIHCLQGDLPFICINHSLQASWILSTDSFWDNEGICRLLFSTWKEISEIKLNPEQKGTNKLTVWNLISNVKRRQKITYPVRQTAISVRKCSIYWYKIEILSYKSKDSIFSFLGICFSLCRFIKKFLQVFRNTVPCH